MLKRLSDHIVLMAIMRNRERLVFAGALLGVGLSLSCGNTTAPPPGQATTVVVIATDTNDLSVVDPSQGKVTGHIGPLPRLKSRGTIAPDHATLYLLVVGDSTTELVAIDTRSLRIQWRLDVATLKALSDSLPVSIGYAMAVTPDGTRLLARSADAQGDGIAVVDLQTRTAVGFIPLAEILDIAAVAPSAGVPNGAILVAAVRQIGPALYDGLFYVLDGATLAVRDSVTVTPSTDDATGGMQQVLAAPDGRHAYVVGFQQFRYDLVDQRMTDSVPTPSYGWLSITSDGSTLYRSDAGSFDFPGTGKIFVYGADLTPRAPINVTQIAPSPGTNGEAVVTGNIIPSSDGKLLYVAAGTPRAGGYGPGEPARLLVIDPQADALVEAIPVRGWSPLVMFAR